jgi:hypothetical protein
VVGSTPTLSAPMSRCSKVAAENQKPTGGGLETTSTSSDKEPRGWRGGKGAA